MTIVEVHYYDAYSPSLSTPFLPGPPHLSGSEAPPKGSILDNFIVDTQVVAEHHRMVDSSYVNGPHPDGSEAPQLGVDSSKVIVAAAAVGGGLSKKVAPILLKTSQ